MCRSRRPRILRVARARLRRLARRWDRRTPEWLAWLAPWTTSLVVHSGLLLVLAIFVYRENAGRREAVLDAVFSNQLSDTPGESQAGERNGDPFTTMAPPEPTAFALEPSKPTAEAVNLSALPADLALGAGLNLAPDLGPRPEAKGAKGSGPAALASIGTPSVSFAGRQGEMKAKLLLKEGGTKESERAVELGLEWLARHQRADGGWSLDTSGQCSKAGCPPRAAMQSDTGATGLALLPFLGAGHTHVQKGRYQTTIRRGLAWLMKVQRSSGELFTGGSGISEFYSHGVASMALCEAYGITNDPGLRFAAQKAINFMGASQNKFDGGWRYTPGQEGDTSVYGWQLFALRSASMSGLNVSKTVLKRCRQYLDSAAADPDGTSYAYQPGRPATPVMTAQGLLVRQYFGWKRDDPRLLHGADLVSRDLAQTTERNIYYWYYASQMLHNMHDKHWAEWNSRVRDGLIRMQVGGDGCDRGSWDPTLPEPDKWGSSAGRLYTTSMSLLTLEVYYRYLPLYKDGGEIEGTAEGALAAEAIKEAKPPARGN